MRLLILTLVATLCAACGGGTSSTPSGSSHEVAPSAGLVALVDSSAPPDDLLLSQFCSGALIARDLVVTVAHCVLGKEPARVDAVIGATNLCRTAPILGTRLHVVAVTILPRGPGGELAVLKLAAPASQRPYTLTAAGGPYVAQGWGSDAVNGATPCRPRRVNLAAAANAWCVAAGKAASRRFDPVSELCLRPTPPSARNTCTGDSGGPVTPLGQPNVLVAVTDWGPSCAPTAVGIYPKVTASAVA